MPQRDNALASVMLNLLVVNNHPVILTVGYIPFTTRTMIRAPRESPRR